MKKYIGIMLSIMMLLVLIGCASTNEASQNIAKWDCSVECADSSEEYVITYSEVKVTPKTGVLTIQNRNDFEIVVHLLCAGKEEMVSDPIPSGGSYSFLKATDSEYTVGVHADVDKKTEIMLFVYDGENTEPYTK